jgi:hypothetical protein
VNPNPKIIEQTSYYIPSALDFLLFRYGISNRINLTISNPINISISIRFNLSISNRDNLRVRLDAYVGSRRLAQRPPQDPEPMKGASVAQNGWRRHQYRQQLQDF